MSSAKASDFENYVDHIKDEVDKTEYCFLWHTTFYFLECQPSRHFASDAMVLQFGKENAMVYFVEGFSVI